MILVVGSINMDFVIEVDKLPQKGESVHGKNIRYIPGGKGANQAVAVKRLGADVALIGKVGEDVFGKDLRKFLENEKLDLSGLQTAPTSSGIAAINVDKSGDNTITIISGANGEVMPEFIEENINLVKESKVVISQFEIPDDAVEKLFALAKKDNKITILNPSPAKQISPKLFKNTDYLVVNETELALLSKMKVRSQKEIEIAAKLMHSKGPKAVVVTLGADGALTISGKETITTDGIKVKAVDTTAAGDCFVGAFAVQIEKGRNLKEALDFANQAAAISVQKMGASSSLPLLNEITS